MPVALTPEQISVFLILAVAFGLLITERLRNDVVALLIVLALYLTRVLSPQEALSGFGSEPAITVAAIFVLSAALRLTGVSGTIGQWIGRWAGANYTRATAVIMPTVALFSAFTHHVTTTAIMLPVTLNLSRERNIPASKLLMPLAIAASLGTTITIIGAPAFIIASEILQRAGRPALGIFSIAPIGLALSAVGTLYMLTIGRFLLPAHEGAEDQGERYLLNDYFTELKILDGSSYLGLTPEQLEADRRRSVQIVGWMRDGQRLRRPYREQTLSAGDVLLIRTDPAELLNIRQDRGVQLNPIVEYGADLPESTAGREDPEQLLVQAVVAPGADIVGRTLGNLDFRQRYGAVVVGIWRQQGWLAQELSKIRLSAGDVLVLQGDAQALERVGGDRAFLMLVPFQAESQLRRKAPLAAAIMLGTIIAAASGLFTIEMAALAGATVAVLTRCLSARQAYRAIDPRIFVFIAGVIPLGDALQKSGASELLARLLQSALGSLAPMVILLIIFAVVAVLTQFMSDAATTALFAPVAVALAQGLGQPPEPYVITVAMASVVAFLTPIGHHGNLLVYQPGRYQFADFVKVGTPLTILCAFVVVFIASLLWKG